MEPRRWRVAAPATHFAVLKYEGTPFELKDCREALHDLIAALKRRQPKFDRVKPSGIAAK